MALEELARLNRRYGEHIGSEVIEVADDIQARLKEAEKRIKRFKASKETAAVLSESLERQQEILQIIEEAAESGSPLTAMDLYGILALRYGVEKKGLFPYAKSINAMAERGFISRRGNSYLKEALQKGMVADISEVVKRSTEPMIFTDIAEKLSLKSVDRFSRFRINTSLNLLDTINSVLKLPVHSGHYGHPIVWLNPAYRKSPKTIPYWNLKYLVLLHLTEHGSATIDNLASDKRIADLISISRFGSYKGCEVKRALDDLLQFRLISCKKENIGKRGTIVYSIYPEAIELVDLTETQGYLDERLRRLLHGERYVGLVLLDKIRKMLGQDSLRMIAPERTVNILGKEYLCLFPNDSFAGQISHKQNILLPTEQITLNYRVRRVGRILGSRKQGEFPTELARRIKENYNYVRNIIYKNNDPLRGINEDTLLSVYLPHLTGIEQKGIKIYLSQRNEK